MLLAMAVDGGSTILTSRTGKALDGTALGNNRDEPDKEAGGVVRGAEGTSEGLMREAKTLRRRVRLSTTHFIIK